jgi:predicted RNA-binding protein with TRAM domain
MVSVWLAAGAGGAVLVVLLLVLFLWRRGGADATESRRAHDEAQGREPPVEIGGSYEMGITEFTDHHSGERVAVGKVEGFVVFTEDVPAGVDEGDAIRATITSFNRGRTSADATFDETV